MKKLFVLSLLVFCVPGYAYLVNDAPNMCVFGAFDAVAVFERNTYTCNAGYYLPANTDGCVACPNGAVCGGGTFEFNETRPQGIKYTAPFAQTQTDLCSTMYNLFTPEFEINTYTCSAGYYLPANTDGCRACPNGAVCSGGTFEFNETTPQGIKYTAPFTQTQTNLCSEKYNFFVPVFEEITSATCASGYYLPADAAACASCPTGYTCAGGTYNFDENNDQGLVANSIAITWQDNDGTTITTNNCTYGQLITLPSNPTRKGYTFTGWRVVNN